MKTFDYRKSYYVVERKKMFTRLTDRDSRHQKVGQFEHWHRQKASECGRDRRQKVTECWHCNGKNDDPVESSKHKKMRIARRGRTYWETLKRMG